MRIIAGQYKGHKLFAPAGLSIRPTSDRVRETLFAVLSPSIIEARFLDLFAGSGAVGMEALSRGASEVVFNDQSSQSMQLIEKNLHKLGAQARVYRFSADAFLSRLAGKIEPFDIVFCDPPYQFDRSRNLLGQIDELGWLRPAGILVYESTMRAPVPSAPPALQCVREQTLGETRLTYFRSLSDG